VIPFLLRGVNLLGIDSVTVPYERRVRAWDRIVSDLPMGKLEAMVRPGGAGGPAGGWGRRS
jgi:acrylyl-CoA reductase (NADPH)